MPIARGTMQMGRINVFPTTTTLVSINPPDIGFCGDLITFTVTVANNRGAGFPVPTGTVLIKDNFTNTTLASGALVPGVNFSTVVIASTISISNNEIYAEYAGIVNQFGLSQSIPVPYSVSIVGTVTSITNTPGEDFCFHNNYDLRVHVQRAPLTIISSLSNGAVLPESVINVISTDGFQSPGNILVVSSNGLQNIIYTGITSTSFTGCIGGTGTLSTGNSVSIATPISTGNVQVNLYSDPVSFVTIGTAALNGSGNATVVLPADTTVPGNNYYIQARYLGAVCLGTSASPTGTNGTLIHSVSLTQNTTTTTAGVSGSTTFCINSSKTFNATIGSAFLGGPSIGSVTWTAVKSPTTIFLGTDFSVVAGVASIVVPSATFPSTGTWTVTAAYTGDGYCFANSTSIGLSVIPTRFEIDFNKIAGASSFCRATGQLFVYTISSSFVGTINGTFALKSSLGNTLASVTTSGPSTGFNVQLNIAANTISAGVQNIFVQFTPISNSCYDPGNSSNFGVTATSSSNQLPASTTLSISPANGSSATTFMFTITIQKGSGSGPLDGAGSLNGSASLYVFDNTTLSFHLITSSISIFDNGTFGSGSYSTSGFPSSTTGAKVVWNGNSCYGVQESSFEEMDVFNQPH